MRSLIFGILFLFVVSVACTGGRRGTNRDGYCFNNEETGKYDPIPLEFKHDNFRKAVFNLKSPEEQVEEAKANPENPDKAPKEVAALNMPTYGGGDLKDKVLRSEEERKRREEAHKKELAKIYPIEVGTFEYVEAEIFLTKELPQKVARNNHQRIHVVHHKKNDKEDEMKFANRCVTNMPQHNSIAPMTVESITSFRVLPKWSGVN